MGYNYFCNYMRLNTFPDGIRHALIISVILSLSSFLYAQDSRLEQAQDKGSSEEEGILSVLQKEARVYRAQGFELQNKGELEEAMSFYQKAAALDPSSAVVLNDLGVVYEARGSDERAKECFQQAITIDPYYLSAYTNLALLAEKERDLDQAYIYWKKRAELGFSGEYWTEKAKQRLGDICSVLSTFPLSHNGIKTKADSASELSLSRQLFSKAKQEFLNKDYAQAMKDALGAQYLDPTNKDIAKFIEKIQKRALSR